MKHILYMNIRTSYINNKMIGKILLITEAVFPLAVELIINANQKMRVFYRHQDAI